MSTEPLLQVENLRIDIQSDGRRHNAVENLSFSIGSGETYGLVGESGCGKSISALSIIGLLRAPMMVAGGSIRFKGQDLLTLNRRQMQDLRGNRIAMIFQEPMTALNPLSPVGRQIAEMFVLHQGASWKEAEKKAVAALASVQVPAPEQRARAYPHQMSGGMRQRVMIAIAMACNPDLLIADEPTTALDVTVQAEILRLMRDLCEERGTAVLMISHDLGVIARMCSRIGVMYAGHLVEERRTVNAFRRPSHPYTRGLLASLPRFGSRQADTKRRLQEIEGSVPAISRFPQGCRFQPRCTQATALCQADKPEPDLLSDGGFVRCFNHE